MDEADAHLTRKAVEEIMKEMHKHKEPKERPQQEKKINPLGRTNKQFLGRTLNAMVRHNKRADEQTRSKCNKKLKELERNRYKHYTRKKSSSHDRKNPHENKRSHYLKDYSTSDSESYRSKRKKKHKKSKTKKKKKRKSRSNKSSDSSSNDEKIEKNALTCEQSYNNLEDADHGAYLMAPTLWDVQMQQFHQHKMLLALGIAAAQAANNNSMEVVDLSSSSPSLSDIKLDESTTSSDEDNREVLTISLTDSDDDNDVHKKVPAPCLESSTEYSSSIEISDSDSISVKSAISVESREKAIDLTED